MAIAAVARLDGFEDCILQSERFVVRCICQGAAGDCHVVSQRRRLQIVCDHLLAHLQTLVLCFVQVYPEGNQSNNNQFMAAATGTISAIDGLKVGS